MNAHTATGGTLRATFQTPYEGMREYVGRAFRILSVHDHSTDPEVIDEDAGELYRIRFDDGVEIDAWPEEIFDGLTTARMYEAMPHA